MVVHPQVSIDDGLPQLMCVPCVLQVSRAFNFKKQCQRSDQKLRECRQCADKSLADSAKSHEIETEIASNVEPFALIDVPCDGEAEIVTESDIENVVTAFEESQTSDSYDLHFSDESEQDNNNSKCLLIVPSDAELDADQLVEQITLDASNVCDLNGENVSFASNGNLLADQLNGSANAIEDHQISGDSMPGEVHVKSEANTKSTEFGAELLDAEHITESLIDNNYTENTYFEPKSGVSESDSSEAIGNDEIEDFSSNAKAQSGECNMIFESISAEEALPIAIHKSAEKQARNRQRAASKESFECPECHKVFAENKILNRHLKIHDPVKKHVCSECNMSFSESSNLTKHLKKHTGELRNVVGKPNLCAVCGKGFKWASSLSKHMKHHTGHRILRCPYCPKYYVEARSLNIHLRKHTGERPFVCDICKKAFTQMGNLEKHLRVHTGERPYKCPVCGKGFSQSGYVTIHLRYFRFIFGLKCLH